jgi:DNA modification methylase
MLEGDCLPYLRAMPAAHVDAVVTDPPWNLGKRYAGHDDAMAPDRYVEWLGGVLAECARIARGAVVLLPGACNAGLERALLRRAGLGVAARLTWRKPAPEPVLWTGARPPPGLPETIWAPEPPAHDPAHAEHPCPKPVELVQVLVGAAVPPGGTVLDPFAGTGATLVAAAQSGHAAIGIELEPRFCRVARRRAASVRDH